MKQKSKNSKIKVVRFAVEGRLASLEDMYYSDDLKDILSFSAPGCQFSPQYKQWVRTTIEYNEDPDNAPLPSGWNGKVSMMKNGSIGVGLLLGYKDVMLKAGFKVKIIKWRRRPEVERVKVKKVTIDKKYQYQVDCVKAMGDCIDEFGGGLVVAATGSGKTKISADFFATLKGDAVFIVDQVDLLYQSQKEISEWLKEKVGVVGNSKFEPQRITVATIQTLHKHQNTARFRHWQKTIDVVVIDEVHVQMSRRNFDVVTSMRPQAVIGLTATLQMRKKNVAMKAMNICGPVVFKYDIKTGAADGILAHGVVVQVEVPENTRERKWITYKTIDKKTGKEVEKERKEDDYEYHVVYNSTLDATIEAIVKEALNREYASAVLVERVKHVTRLSKRLKRFEPRLFYGAVSTDERKKSIRHFEKGKAELILANKVFTKGINVKRLDLAIDAAMRQSKNDCIQKYGRLVRLHTEKKGAIFFELIVLPAMKKAADSQKSAFRAAKIPLVRIPWTNAKDALKTAEKELTKVLKGSKNE